MPVIQPTRKGWAAIASPQIANQNKASPHPQKDVNHKPENGPAITDAQTKAIVPKSHSYRPAIRKAAEAERVAPIRNAGAATFNRETGDRFIGFPQQFELDFVLSLLVNSTALGCYCLHG
jgi:hypothetical protein